MLYWVARIILNQARQSVAKLNKSSPFVTAFSGISCPLLTLVFSSTSFFMTPVCLRSESSLAMQTLFARSTPWLPTTSLLRAIKYSAMQRPGSGQRKQGEGGTWLQFLFVFLCGYRDSMASNFPLLYHFSPLPSIDPGSVKQKTFFFAVLEANTQLKHRCVCLTGLFAMEVLSYCPGRGM